MTSRRVELSGVVIFPQEKDFQEQRVGALADPGRCAFARAGNIQRADLERIEPFQDFASSAWIVRIANQEMPRIPPRALQCPISPWILPVFAGWRDNERPIRIADIPFRPL